MRKGGGVVVLDILPEQAAYLKTIDIAQHAMSLREKALIGTGSFVKMSARAGDVPPSMEAAWQRLREQTKKATEACGQGCDRRELNQNRRFESADLVRATQALRQDVLSFVEEFIVFLPEKQRGTIKELILIREQMLDLMRSDTEKQNAYKGGVLMRPHTNPGSQ